MTQHTRLIVAPSLLAILAIAGIDVRVRTRALRLQPGREERATCPACQGGKTRELSLAIRVDNDGRGIVWRCHRGTCQGSSHIPGGGRIAGATRPLGDQAPILHPRTPLKTPVPDPLEAQKRPPGMLAYLAARGLSAATAETFGVYEGRHWFPQVAGELSCLVFPYLVDGKLVNRKFRSYNKEFAQDKEALRTLFNVDRIQPGGDVVFVEGELDVLALHEAGVGAAVSLPDGAPGALRDEADPARHHDRRFEALTTCADALATAGRFIIATDADVPGGYLAEELARRLGRARSWRVTWPTGTKDANDVLVQHGPAAVRDAIDAAVPWPLAGLFTLRRGALSEFRRRGLAPRGLEAGIADLDAVARIPAEGGRLTVVTGVPSHGKTTLLRAWLVYLAARYGTSVVYASPEDGRPETVAIELAAILEGKPWRERQSEPAMTDAELDDAERWVARNFDFIHSDNPDAEMTLDWVLKRAEEAKQRAARHLLVLDPWNEFEHQFGRNETETQYVGRWLRRLKAWGRAEGMGIIIVAHPTKLPLDRNTKRYPLADGYDISGGANWFNRADLGVTAYRTEEGFIEAHCWKARYRAYGERHRQARLHLVESTGRLQSTLGAADARPEPAGAPPVTF